MAEKVSTDVEHLGILIGHEGPVTSIVVGHAGNADDDDTILVSGSRDKTLIIWELYNHNTEGNAGRPLKCLTGHNHFVSDLSISNDNTFVMSSSWDKTMRLWDLRSGKCVRTFIGHEKEVFTGTFSSDNRQIFSAGAEKSLKLWNTLAECKATSDLYKQHGGSNKNNDHTDWVSKVRFSQSTKTQYYATVGWDGRLKLWSGIFAIFASIKAHEGYINALDIARNGMFIATGGKDQVVKVWDYLDLKHPKFELKCESQINNIAFNGKYQWLAAATDSGVKIWDLAARDSAYLFAQISTKDDEESTKKSPTCTSLAWSANGNKIYCGDSDGRIHVYSVMFNHRN